MNSSEADSIYNEEKKLQENIWPPAHCFCCFSNAWKTMAICFCYFELTKEILSKENQTILERPGGGLKSWKSWSMSKPRRAMMRNCRWILLLVLSKSWPMLWLQRKSPSLEFQVGMNHSQRFRRWYWRTFGNIMNLKIRKHLRITIFRNNFVKLIY